MAFEDLRPDRHRRPVDVRRLPQVENQLRTLLQESHSLDEAVTPTLLRSILEISGVVAAVVGRLAEPGAPGQDALQPEGLGEWLDVERLRDLAAGLPSGELVPLYQPEIDALGLGSWGVRSGALYQVFSAAHPDARLVLLVLEQEDEPRALKGGAPGGRAFFLDLARDLANLDLAEAQTAFHFGRSAAARTLEERAGRLARDEEARVVLLTGERGSGKTTLARWMHLRSARARGPFVEYSCRAHGNPDLFHAELCGSRKGAYTGSERDQKGLLALAEWGTLFIDNLQVLDWKAQAELLKLLEPSATYRPMGSERVYRVSCRFILATNRHLAELEREGRLDHDFADRIRAWNLALPGLLEYDPQDIREFAARFLRIAWRRRGRGGPPPRLPLSLPRMLRERSFGGNFRGLREAMSVLAAELSPSRLAEDGPGEIPRELLERVLQPWSSQDVPSGPMSEGIAKPGAEHEVETLETVKRRYARWAVEACGGNRSAAAGRLGIAVPTLRRLLREDEG